MAKVGRGRIIKVGDSVALRFPYRVRDDEAWPFKIGEEIIVRIKKKEVVLSKLGE